MIDQMTKALDFHSQALALRAERQRVLAGNIANADTPNYKAVDFDFAQALRTATNATALAEQAGQLNRTHPQHVAVPGLAGTVASLQYRMPAQAAIDNNSVDMDMERAQFADNAVRYEATLRFINSQVRTMLSAIRGEPG